MATKMKLIGDVIPWSASTALTADTVVEMGNSIGVVVTDIAASGTGCVAITGVATLTARSAGNEAWTIGDVLYWDTTSDCLTDVWESDCILAGTAASIKAASDTTADVVLHRVTPPKYIGGTVTKPGACKVIPLTYRNVLISEAAAGSGSLATGAMGQRITVTKKAGTNSWKVKPTVYPTGGIASCVLSGVKDTCTWEWAGSACGWILVGTAADTTSSPDCG